MSLTSEVEIKDPQDARSYEMGVSEVAASSRATNNPKEKKKITQKDWLLEDYKNDHPYDRRV